MCLFTVVERNPYKTPRAAPPTPAAARSTILSLQSFQTINGLEPERVGFVDRSFFFISLLSLKTHRNLRVFRAVSSGHQTSCLSQPSVHTCCCTRASLRDSRVRFESNRHAEPRCLFAAPTKTTDTDRGYIYIFFFYLRRLDGSGGLTLAVCRPTHESAQGNIVERNRETDRKKPRQMAESGAGCYPERTEDRSRG